MGQAEAANLQERAGGRLSLVRSEGTQVATEQDRILTAKLATHPGGDLEPRQDGTARPENIRRSFYKGSRLLGASCRYVAAPSTGQFLVP